MRGWYETVVARDLCNFLSLRSDFVKVDEFMMIVLCSVPFMSFVNSFGTTLFYRQTVDQVVSIMRRSINS